MTFGGPVSHVVDLDANPNGVVLMAPPSSPRSRVEVLARLRSWPALAVLVGWTLVLWFSRLRNVLGGDELTGWGLGGVPVLSRSSSGWRSPQRLGGWLASCGGRWGSGWCAGAGS